MDVDEGQAGPSGLQPMLGIDEGAVYVLQPEETDIDPDIDGDVEILEAEPMLQDSALLQPNAPQNSEDIVNLREADNNDDTDTVEQKLTQLPVSRIRSIMKLDPDITVVNQDAVVLIAKATEFFIENLVKEAYAFTAQAKKKTLQKRDVDASVERVEALSFLEGTLEG